MLERVEGILHNYFGLAIEIGTTKTFLRALLPISKEFRKES